MKSKRIIGIAASVIILISFILAGAGWKFSTNLLHAPARCQPAHVYCKGPEELGLPSRDVRLTTVDGVLLEGWLIPAENSKKIIVFVHGFSANRHAGLRYAKALRGAGFNYLLVNLRGAMKDPEKSFFSMGYHEQKDVKAMIDYAVNDLAMDSVGIMGTSMGASTAIAAMAKDPRIKAGIFNSGFSGVRAELADRAKKGFGLPAFPLVDIIMLMASLRGDIDFAAVDPLEHIGKIAPRPVFIFHSVKDPQVGFHHARQLFQRAGEPRELWEGPWPGHVMDWNNDREESERRVTAFFGKYL